MFDGLEDLRCRADGGDAAACIALGDRLLARAPYEAPPWEADARWRDLRQCERHADLRATDAFDYGVYDGLIYFEAVLTHARLLRALREEDLGRATPERGIYLEAAARYHERAARAGDPAGMWRLGWRHWLGQGVPADTDTALLWWRRAADLGAGEAKRLLERLGFLPDATLGQWDPAPVLSRTEVMVNWPRRNARHGGDHRAA